MKKLFFKNLFNFIPLFLLTLTTHLEIPKFLKQHQVWKGFLKYTWVSKFLLVVAMILGFNFLSIFLNWFRQVDTSTVLGFTTSVGVFAQEIGAKGYGLVTDGALKYVILILIEVLIFHATYKTLQVITKEDRPTPKLEDFIAAQKRMFIVVLRAFILEKLSRIAVNIVLGFLGLMVLEDIMGLLIQCYFLGVVIVDNYHEHRQRSIKEGLFISHQIMGISLGVGLVLYCLLYIPFVGAIVGPLVAATAATLVMYEVEEEWQLELEMPLPKEKDK